VNFQEYYFKEDDAKAFVNEVMLILEEESDSIGLNPAFIAGMSNYLEKCFPSYGNFDVAVGNEIRKYMKGDNSYVKKVKKRIHEIINKCKGRFLHDVINRTEKIKVQPKEKPKAKPPIYNDPLMSDEPSTGDAPPNVAN
jgi:hypothetical protein